MMKKENLVAPPLFSPRLSLKIPLILLLQLSLISFGQAQDFHQEHSESPESSFFQDIRTLIRGRQNPSMQDQIFSKGILKLAVKRGDSLKSILNQLKINKEDMEEVLSTFKRLGPEKVSLEDANSPTFTQQFSAVIEFVPDVINRSKNRLYSLFLKTPNDTQITIKRNTKDELKSGGNEDVQKDITYEKKIGFQETIIKENVQEMIEDLKLNSDQARKLFQLLSYEVDFERELKIGQHLQVVTEQFYFLNGEYSHTGEILYVSMELEGRWLKLFRHESFGGQTNYYNEEGQSVKHILMKTPIPSALISSDFGMRHHPISDYNKFHKGVDFRAPKGTPILAAGEGRIVFKGRRKGYGNYLIIEHGPQLQTAYAHISKYEKSLRVGDIVKQGDVVAFVGSTGRSTGPHLHYEVILNNERINPIEYSSSSLEGLTDDEKDAFDSNKEKIEDLLESYEASTDK